MPAPVPFTVISFVDIFVSILTRSTSLTYQNITKVFSKSCLHIEGRPPVVVYTRQKRLTSEHRSDEPIRQAHVIRLLFLISEHMIY